MSNMIPFYFDGHSVRVIDRSGSPWFVLADVCHVLEIGNPSDAAKRLDGDECTLDTIEGSHRPTNLVNEPGLYSLILTSRKEQARRFKRWVTHEVLPSIRRHGGYVAGQEETDDPALIMARALQVAQSVIEQKTKELSEAKPKVAVYDRITDAGGTVTLTAAAKTIGVGPRKMIQAMLADGILYRQSGALTAYQQHIDAGRFEVKLGEANGHAFAHLKVTAAGVQWLAQRYVTELVE